MLLYVQEYFQIISKQQKLSHFLQKGTKMKFKITGQFLVCQLSQKYKSGFSSHEWKHFSGKTKRFQTYNTILENQNLRKLPLFSQRCCFINRPKWSTHRNILRSFESLRRYWPWDLALKLPSYGIRGIALDWITSYLKHRTQRVEIPYWQERTLHTYISNSLPIVHGVPQG